MKQFKKLTFEAINTLSENNIDICSVLTERVAMMYFGSRCDLAAEFEYCLEGCESPIEQLLAIDIEVVLNRGEVNIPLLLDLVGIEKQKEIECDGKIYRVDFAIFIKYWNCEKWFLVECDGHEFHQKTKKQVERDNERTRSLQRAGYTVIHFSGTEIYHRSRACALELKDIIQAPAIKFIERSLNNESRQN